MVAGGAGRRFGGAKQYLAVAGRSVLDHSVAAARAVSGGVVVVVPADDVGSIVVDADHVVAGGTTRAGSVRAGLAVVPDTAAVVLVHDAARPAASPALFERVVAAVDAGAAAVVPGIAVTDSLRHRDDGAIDRDRVVAVQTPQGFRAGALRAAHATGLDATDDATLAELAGDEVVVVDGELGNRKLTHPDDVATLERALADQETP